MKLRLITFSLPNSSPVAPHSLSNIDFHQHVALTHPNPEAVRWQVRTPEYPSLWNRAKYCLPSRPYDPHGHGWVNHQNNPCTSRNIALTNWLKLCARRTFSPSPSITRTRWSKVISRFARRISWRARMVRRSEKMGHSTTWRFRIWLRQSAAVSGRFGVERGYCLLPKILWFMQVLSRPQ